MVRALRWILGGAVAGIVAAGIAGCSVLLDWGDYTGEKNAATCAAATTCAPRARRGVGAPESSGGEPTGSVASTQPTTFCCTL